MPLGTRGMFGPRFEAMGRAVAARQCTATGTITRAAAGPEVYDDTTGRTTRPARGVIYSGPVRVQSLLRQAAYRSEFAGQSITTSHYLVTLPFEGSPVIHTDDFLTVDDASDPALEGAGLRVTDPTTGSITWQRTFLAVNDHQ